MGINSAIRTLEEFVNEAKQLNAAAPSPAKARTGTARVSRAGALGREPLLDARATASYLNLSVSWVYKAAERGELPCLRIGAALRFDPEALHGWVRGRATKTTKVCSI